VIDFSFGFEHAFMFIGLLSVICACAAKQSILESEDTTEKRIHQVMHCILVFASCWFLAMALSLASREGSATRHNYRENVTEVTK